jgi:hypothetical protein
VFVRVMAYRQAHPKANGVLLDWDEAIAQCHEAAETSRDEAADGP